MRPLFQFFIALCLSFSFPISLSQANEPPLSDILPHEQNRIEFLRSLAVKADEPWTGQNELQLLNTGKEFFPVRLEMIKNANHTIDLITFLWCDDEAGNAIAEELIAAAYRGVRIRVTVDFFNIKGGGPIYERLRNAGIRPLIYHPPSWGWDEINKRIHEKIMIVDGDEALVGGANLCNEYMTGKIKGLWHDLEFHIRGTLASRIQLHMDRTWNFMAQKEYEVRRGNQNSMLTSRHRSGAFENQRLVPRIFPLYGQTPSSLLREGSSTALFLYQQTYRDPEHAEKFLTIYSQLVQSARDQVIIVAPYLIPAPEIKEALIATAKRGVRVQLLTNSQKSIDKTIQFVANSSRGHYLDLLAAGVEIYESQATTFHSKAILIDSHYLTVGSHNFTNRSFRMSGESAILTTDGEAIAKFKQLTQESLKTSKKIHYEKFRSLKQGRWGGEARSGFYRWLGHFF
jgi:cardiolipin synthase A/B